MYDHGPAQRKRLSAELAPVVHFGWTDPVALGMGPDWR